MENKGAIGKITQVISAVLDIKFSEGHLPEINDAIRIPLKKGGELMNLSKTEIQLLMFLLENAAA